MKLYQIVCLAVFVSLASCLEEPTGFLKHIFGRQSENIPYQVSLRHNQYNTHICSGVVLEDDWILTTARCVGSYGASEISVAYGARRLSRPYHIVDIEKIIIHPGFDAEHYGNDLALLQLKTKLNFTSKLVSSIALSTAAPIDGESAIVTGWGVTTKHDDQSYPDSIQSLDASVISCQAAAGPFSIYLHGVQTICTKYHGLVRGDLGSPLVSRSNELLGLASCFATAEGKPNVYTAVYAYQHWIQTTTRPKKSFFSKLEDTYRLLEATERLVKSVKEDDDLVSSAVNVFKEIFQPTTTTTTESSWNKFLGNFGGELNFD